MSASALTCAQARELAPELAMSVLGGAERADVLLHVNGCARCQAVVSELTEVADMLPQLVPDAEPPAGFEARVLRRFGDAARRSRRRWIAAVAAIALAVAIVTVTTVRVIESNDRMAPSVESAGAPVQVAMRVGTAATPAGWAYISGGRGVAIAVDYGMAPGAYTVRITPTQGDAFAIGTMQVAEGGGSWTGRSDALVQAGSRLALVDRTGNEACHGTVPSAG